PCCSCRAPEGQGTADKKELSEESEDEELQVEEFPMLKTLDPKAWKSQDHYAVLGLGHVRYIATQRQIKAAHKIMVLKHHPDKRKVAGEPIKEGDNDYFTCITKAYEMLSDPLKRRAFNSVDPTFNNSVPSKSEAKENFFERNYRWSNKKNVPKLGDMNSSFEDVDAFYSFWYNFDSITDQKSKPLYEEEKEKAECRDERRWIEKQNRAIRAQRKKEEMNRIRALVDNTYSCDPRIKKFKEEEKAKKEAEKKAKAEAKRKEQEAKEKQRQAQLDAVRLAKEKEVRQQALLAKKEKHIQKKAELVKMMEEVEKLCGWFDLTSLQSWNEVLTSSTKKEERLEPIREEKEEEAEARMRQVSKNAEQSAGGSGSGSNTWSEDDLQLLIKAANLFSAGTNSRWEVIANYMNIHSSSGIKRTAKVVIGKARSLQNLDPHKKDDINCTPWTTVEQNLEQALKTYPVNTPERWEKIAEAVPGQTKKDLCYLKICINVVYIILVHILFCGVLRIYFLILLSV
uniref:J domain-containing protein n=1 Tax=Jaculus jaculus TaxID=51337 RepID=A0A8C5K571_JACJA